MTLTQADNYILKTYHRGVHDRQHNKGDNRRFYRGKKLKAYRLGYDDNVPLNNDEVLKLVKQ